MGTLERILAVDLDWTLSAGLNLASRQCELSRSRLTRFLTRDRQPRTELHPS